MANKSKPKRRSREEREISLPEGVTQRNDDGVDTRWWVHIMPSVDSVGPGTYGVFADRPTFSVDERSRVLTISGADDEPTIVVNLNDVLTVYTAQPAHVDAKPGILPASKEEESDEESND